MKYFDDDMDELFNKAGRQYPLKTEPKDWDAVRAALAVEQGAAASAIKPGRRYKRFLPLLLLLLIPAVYMMLDKENVKVNENAKINDGVVTKTDAVDTKEEKAVADASVVMTRANGNSSETPVVKKEKNLLRAGRVSNDNVQAQLRIKQINPELSYTVGASTSLSPRASGNQTLNAYLLNLHTEKTTFTNPYESIKTPFTKLVSPNEPVSVPISYKTKKHKGTFYYGVAAGPDLTTIKGQKIKGLGYSAGIIAGYNLNPKLSIEAGVLWSNKKYFTKGKYFSKEGANIPPSVDVKWLDGGCDMLEFPISVRYSFTPKRNTFFIGGGITSFLMKKEDYDYGAVVWPSDYYYEGYRTYKRSGDHLFANVQLSGGYKFGLTSKMNVRIEPFLKAPLKKIGIGKMPITSTGLYFSVTRDLR